MSVEIQRVRADVCAAIFADELNDFYGGSPFVEFVRIDDEVNITISFETAPTTQNLTDLDTILTAHDCSIFDDLEDDGDNSISYVLNNSGVDIQPGLPVYITGFDVPSNLITIALADAAVPSKMPAFGCTMNEIIKNGEQGNIVTNGQISLIDTSMFVAGDQLYVAPGGGHTTTKPTGDNQIQKMAQVILSDSINGKSQIFGAGRTNDIPNISTGKVWMGDGSKVPQETDVYTKIEVNNLLTALDDWVNETGDTMTGDLIMSGTAVVKLIDGTTTAPGISFASATNTGMWLEPTGDLAFSVGGSEIFEIQTDGRVIISNSYPTYENLVTFDNVIPNKKYVDDAISTAVVPHPDPHRLGDGSTTSPTYSFSADTNTGLYRESNGDIAFSQNGTCTLEVTTANKIIISGEVPNYETLVTSDNVIPNKKYVDDAIAANTGIIKKYDFFANQVEMPRSGSDWTKTNGAPASRDSNNNSLTVRRFDDSTEEGIGFFVSIPSNATNMVIRTKARAESSPGSTKAAIPKLYKRMIPNNGTIGSWTNNTLTTISLPTNERWQYDETSNTLTSWGLTAGNVYQIEFTRNTASGSDTLSGDLALLLLEVEFS